MPPAGTIRKLAQGGQEDDQDEGVLAGGDELPNPWKLKGRGLKRIS